MTEKKEFIMLITHSRENDRAVERLADPRKPLVFFKLGYVRPCDRFEEIKAFQARLWNSPAVKGKRVTAAVDLSDWAERENEEYLIASLKFFSDMRDRLDLIFTVGGHSREEVCELYNTARRYMRGKLVEDKTLTDKNELSRYIQSRYAEPDAADILAEMLGRKEMSEIRNIPSVDEMCDEMLALSPVGVIRPEDVYGYVVNENSLPFITDKTAARETASECIKYIASGRKPAERKEYHYEP